MATQVQNRRGTTAEHSTFTGANGELTVDTTKRTLVVHDGATAGGRPLLREDQSNLPTSAPTTGIYNASGSLAISTGGSGRLFVDASGRVSVGENFTSAKFSIAGQGGFLTGAAAATNKGTVVIQDVGISGFTSDGGIEFKASSFGNGYGARILCLDGGELLFGNRANSSAWSERLRITSAGLVGVGTSSPNSIFSISAGVKAANNNYLFLETTDASNKLQLKTSNVSNTAWSIQSEEAGIAYRSLALNPLGGNVGIGTTSPAEVLEVNGNIRLSNNPGSFRLFGAADSSNTTVVLQAGATSGSGGNIELDRNGDVVYDGTNHRFRNVSGGSEYARIDSSGRLLVGTSSDSGGALFQVNGDRIRVGTAKTPASATDTGTAGEICWDASYVYVCTATNTWKRSALSTW